MHDKEYKICTIGSGLLLNKHVPQQQMAKQELQEKEKNLIFKVVTL
jgi:hypothetical protein